MENFMCHENLKIDFDLAKNNCFFIGGCNGSGKSALFASLNLGLGGKGSSNDRGNSVKNYIKFGESRSKIRILLTNSGYGNHPDYGEKIAIERIISSRNQSSYLIKSVFQEGRTFREKLVSTRKSDLDQLLSRFGIQLNNPVFWMSQDRSRAFLQDFKPDKIYKLFVIATGLDCTRKCYDTVASYLLDMENIQDSIHEILVEKKT
ncbi:unnamed protein product [Dracunculus medinensis]|uniref:Rad50/SbcC-type AAA domain-containing protein n=1 Tax=Dracunculus medinensis TaxID=318479 RepID=A0A3P7PMI0_DRAME|nr:unnamed protein product [Dracunculus medinensis]